MLESTNMQEENPISLAKNAGSWNPDITTKRILLKINAFIAVSSAIWKQTVGRKNWIIYIG